MKSILALIVCCGFLVASAWPQHQHHAASAHKVASSARVDVQDDAATGRLTVRLGPLNLPAESDHTAVAQPPPMPFDVPFDGWITAYHPRLVDAAGVDVPGRMLHHVAFWNTTRSDFLCPNKEEHIFGAGGEMNDWPALPGVGYRVAKGDRIRITSMFHNPTENDYPEVYLEIAIEYQPGSEGAAALKSVYPAWIDVGECGHSEYDLPAGLSRKTGNFRLSYSGILLGVGGHLHDYGRRLELVHVTRGKPVATLAADLDSQGRILSMPTVNFMEQGGYRLEEEDALEVTAIYDNPVGHELPAGAMGIVVGYFFPDAGENMAGLRRIPSRRPSK